MDTGQFEAIGADRDTRLEDAIKKTAPGTALRHALDMIIAGHMGALICVGDTDNVLAAGDDGFKLDVSFTANRLFELCKMDGAIVVDKDLTKILRANYHLNPNPSLPTSETGTRHRTAARMSLLTHATVISVSERRAVVNVYVDGKGFELKPVSGIMASVNQIVVAMQNTRQQLDRSLLRLTSLELDNFVTLGDVTSILYLFEVLMTAGEELNDCIIQLGSEGKITLMQREEFLGGMDEAYTLMIRDYAADSSEENALAIRRRARRGQRHDPARPAHPLPRACGARGHGRQDRRPVRLPAGDLGGRRRRPVPPGRDRRQEPRRAGQQPPPHVGKGRVAHGRV